MNTSESNPGVSVSPFRSVLRRFFSEKLAVASLVFVCLLFLMAVFAPLLVNGKPFFISAGGVWSSPALRDFFAPDAQEKLVETVFNFLMLFLPAGGLFFFLLRRRPRARLIFTCVIFILCTVPFIFVKSKMDRRDYREYARSLDAPETIVFAPIPYGPFETSSETYSLSSFEHPLGTDDVGRDVLARMVYGARVSLAVGFFATLISLVIGTSTGLLSGYLGGRTDLVMQRVVEIVICFPSFLLLLILMAIMLDSGSRQSILLVTCVIGFLGWSGLCRLVRGETLKQRRLAYIQAAESLGVPVRTILFRHLLPNVSGPVFVAFAFDVAGAVLAENSLSFLGFGVQPPTASWGELLRQAFADPLSYWNLMLWPGLAIFLCVCSFNFIADGLRKSIDLKN